MAADAVTLVEVGARDGLQNIAETVPTDVKIAYVNALSAAGLRDIEVTSFVSPKAVPQLADGAAVLAGITRRRGTRYTALVPNAMGLERALAAGVDGVSVFTAASEAFTQANINATIAESISRFQPVLAQATVPVRGYLSTAFWCPFEGKIAPGQARRVAMQLFELGVTQVAVSDTIGKATPDEVEALLDLLLREVAPAQIALHLHDTYGRAADNARAGYAMGITTFDGSAGGIGGCPFAPGAAGNIATELLAATFADAVEIDRAALGDAAALILPWKTGTTRSAPTPA